MVTRFIDALNASNAVIATHTETNDSVMSWDIPTIFPTLVGGTTYNFVMRTPETAGYTVPVTTLLDTLSASAGAAYSTRRLRAGYTGAALRVRRSTDNVEQDIGFNGSGGLDTTALTTFIGVNSGFVVTWYDQTTNARHITNATASQQPRIVNAGTLEVQNGKPSLYFDNALSSRLTNSSPFMYAAGAASSFLVGRFASQSVRTIWAERNSGSGNAIYRLEIEGTDIRLRMRNDASTTIPGLSPGNVNIGDADNTLRVFSFRDTGSQTQGFTNGGLENTISYTRQNPLTVNIFGLGANPTATFIEGTTGFISEAIFFASSVSNADLNAVNASQGGEYGITVSPFLEGEELEFSLALSRDAIFGEFNTNWEGYSANYSRVDRGLGGSVGYPNIFRRQFRTVSGAANRLNANINDLANFDTYAKDLYIGGTARIYRVTSGVMSLVRTSQITDAKMGRWLWLRPNADRVVDALTYTHALDNFNRPSVPYWFRVAAVGSNGLAGTWSAPVSFTPANMTGTPSGTVNPTKAVNKTGEGGALAAPGSVAVTAGTIAREAVVTWNAVAGAEGYVVELSYYDPADQIVAQPYLDLASDPTPILAGDLVIVDRELLTQTIGIYSSRVFGSNKPLSYPMFWNDAEGLKLDGNDYAYTLYSGDKPALAFGDHYLRRTANAGLTARFQQFWHGGVGQTFRPVLRIGTTYRVRTVMRASTPVTVAFTLGGAAACGITGTTFNVGTSFTTFTHDISPTIEPTGADSYDWRMEFTAGGTPINVDVAFFEIQEVGASTNVLSATPPPAGAYLRDHSFIKPGPNNRSVRRLITNQAYGYKAFYDTCVQTNCLPWLQIEWNAPQQDWLDFVAYLAAPNGSHPMADLRQASGIPQPWTTTFSNMKLEMGNEAWQNGSLPEFWIMPNMTDSATATVYSRGNTAGLFWQMISNWMKASPYWSTLAPRLTQHAGGWTINAFGEDAYRFYPDAREIGIASYNGGWDNGAAIPSESGLSFNAVLADPMVTHKETSRTRVAALKSLCTALGRTYGTDIRYASYEAGPNFALPGTATATQIITQEVVMKSRAAGTSTVDTMLALAQQDVKNFNFFVLGTGDNWASHAAPVDGGQELMPNALVRIIHENIAPARVYGAATSFLGTKTVTLQGGGSSAAFNRIGAYQLRNLTNPSKRMIVLVNRNIDPSQLPVADPLYSATPSGTVAFNVTTTWNSASSLRIWTAGVGPYRQHNRYPVGQRRVAGGGLTSDPLCVAFDYSSQVVSVPSNIQNFPVNASIGATSGGLPAGSCLILLFEGVT